MSEVLEVRQLLTSDFGDAPAPYPITVAENGAQHEAIGPMLGASRDSELDGVHSAMSNSDDTAGTPNDEDGVTFGTIRVGELGATATVVVSNAPSGAKLDAWIDFNRDGNWGGSVEHIADSVSVVNGSNTIKFDVPSDAIDGTTFARFRLSTAGNLGVKGSSANGEVEDSSITVLPPISSSGLFKYPSIIATEERSPRAIGDIDQDGDLDLLMTESYIGITGTLSWLENDGAGHFTSHAITSIHSIPSSTRIVDFDGDGDSDIVTSTLNSVEGITWYENDGHQSFTIHRIATSPNADLGAAMDVADMDSDGDLDVLTTSFSGSTITWYENDGHQNFATHTINTTATGIFAVRACDLDRDGDLDIVFSAYRGDLSWLENVGSQGFVSHTISTAEHWSAVALPIDFDGDGDLDLVGIETQDDNAVWYENDGRQNFVTHSILDDNDRVRTLALTDVDGDEDLDILYASDASARIYCLINDGGSTFTTREVDIRAYTDALLLGDINGNGTVDLVIGTSRAQSNFAIGWYSNLIDGTPPTAQISSVLGAKSTDPITFTFQFSEAVTGFTASDISVSNGTAGTFAAVDADTYTLQVTPKFGGLLSVSIAAGVTQDAYANGNTQAGSFVFVDLTAPTLRITPKDELTHADPILFTFQFSEGVTGFTADDIVITNGTAGSLTTIYNALYEMQVTPLADGPVTVTVAANSVFDGSRNTNLATSVTSTSDRTRPTVIISPNGITTSDSSIEFTIQFSEPVYVVDDVTLQNGTLIEFTIVDDDAYRVRVNPVGDGPVLVGLREGSLFDWAGNTMTTTSASVISERNPPHLNGITRVTGPLTNASSVRWNIVFNEAVTGVDVTDFQLFSSGLTGAAITEVTGSGTNYTVSASTGTGEGTLELGFLNDGSIADLAFKPLDGTLNDDGQMEDVAYILDRTAPALVSFIRSDSANRETNSDELYFRLTFRDAVSLDPSDFTVDGLTTATVTEIREVDGSEGKEFELEISGGDLSVYNGPVGLSLSATQTVTDYAGNLLPSVEPNIDETFLLNDTLPEYFVTLVKDIFAAEGSDLRNFVEANGTLFFTADDGVHGRELWKSDGTAAGTRMLKDIILGDESSLPVGLIDVNGTLFFFVGQNTNTTELWKSDGTEAGTVLVKTLRSDGWEEHLIDHQAVEINGTLYFAAEDGGPDGARQLWKSDGTESGTVLVRDDTAETDWSDPFFLTNFNGTLVFVAYDSVNGTGLWKSDGTSAGTVLLKSRSDGTRFVDFGQFTVANDTLFFVADDNVHGDELWKTDGTPANTTLVKDIRGGASGSRPAQLASVDGTLFFSAFTSAHGRELWKSDGTANGTVRLTDVIEGDGQLAPTQLTNFDGTLYFLGRGDDYNITLWKSDGTAAGTGPIYSDLPEDLLFFQDLVQADGRLFFTVHEFGLFVTDGTEAGSAHITDRIDNLGTIEFGQRFAVVNGSVFFAGRDETNDEHTTELFRTTTTPPLPTEPHLLLDINPGPDSSVVSDFLTFDGFTYFAVSANPSGTEKNLWRTDGTAAGTQIVREFVDPSIYFGLGELERVNDAFYFNANDGVHGYELWKSDGTSANTVLVKNITPQIEGRDENSAPQSLTNVNGTLFFIADDGLHGRELWKSDGTEVGTVLVADIRVGGGSGLYFGPGLLTAVNDRVFFLADDGVHGESLWVSDGTAEGTRRLRDQWVSPGGSSYHSPENLTNVDGTLFFTLSSGNTSESAELWKSDGTTEGTVMVRNGFARDTESRLRDFTAFNGQLLFVGAEDGVPQLWTSDGTAEGTVIVAPGQFDLPAKLTNLGDAVFFRAYTEAAGFELWKTDGTAEGTVLFADVVPGNGSSDPSAMVRFDDAIFFVGDSRLWKTDGVSEGSEFRDIRIDLDLGSLIATEHALLFIAETEAFGSEVWIVNATDSTAPTVSSIQRDSSDDAVSGSVQWKVVFTEPVRGVHLDDFQLVGTGFPDAALTNFVGSGTTYFVTATTGAGTGTLGLRLVDNDSIHDASQNPLGGAGTSGLADGSLLGESFVLDTAPPTVTSLTRTSANRTNAGSVSWTVAFSESVTGVNASDFTLLPSGLAGASITNVTGSGDTWTVTASTGSGDGTLGIKLVDDDSIADAVGNPLAGNFTGQVYTLDRTAPNAVSFARLATINSLTNSDALMFRATFSETVLNVDLGDFAVNGAGGSVTNVVAVNGSNGRQFDVTVSGDDMANLEGVVGLDLRATLNITDSVGNALPVTEPLNDQTYTLDNTAPTVTSFTRRLPETSPTNADTLVFRATFSEQVVNVDAADFAVAGTTTATVTGAALVIGSRGTQYDVTISGGDLANFNGLVGLNLKLASTISDLAENAVAVVEPPTDQSFQLDNIAPITVSMMRQSAVANLENPTSLLFRVTFSEAVLNLDTTDFAVNGATTATVTALSGVSGSGGKSFDVTVAGGNLANFNGSVGLNLSATQDLADAAGNALPTAEPTNDQMFSVVAYQHLTYAGTSTAALAVRVVSGQLEVKIGTILQPLASPAMVGSLTFTGGSKNDSINLTGLSSSLYSHLTRIVISGGEGNDTITGSDFAETISGGLGNDVLKGGGGMDCLTESGDVTFVLTKVRLTGLGTDSLAGFDEALLTGGDRANKLDASAFTGNVTLLGGSGDDTLIGGSGNDSLDGALGDDVLTGNAGNDILGSGAGDDILNGGAGNDQLFGGNGIDQIVASGARVYVLDNSSLTGEGTDTLNRMETATITTSARENSSVDASAFDGSVTLIGGAGLDTLTGGSGDDALFGAAGNDVLKGGEGQDVLRGEAGNDTLDGEAGDDSLLGALGNDHLRGGDGNDRLIESANANLTLTNSSLSGLGTDTLSNIETASLTGGTGNNTLTAAGFTLGSVTLIGGAGNDSLVGGTANDSLDGGIGNDTLRGGDGNDTLVGGAGNDGLAGQAGNDSLLGDEGKDTILGGAGNDTLRGGLQDDVLIGGFGIDSIDGELGNDKATGGQGKTGSPRNGLSVADLGDAITAEVIDETFATLFAFE